MEYRYGDLLRDSFDIQQRLTEHLPSSSNVGDDDELPTEVSFQNTCQTSEIRKKLHNQ